MGPQGDGRLSKSGRYTWTPEDYTKYALILILYEFDFAEVLCRAPNAGYFNMDRRCFGGNYPSERLLDMYDDPTLIGDVNVREIFILYTSSGKKSKTKCRADQESDSRVPTPTTISGSSSREKEKKKKKKQNKTRKRRASEGITVDSRIQLKKKPLAATSTRAQEDEVPPASVAPLPQVAQPSVARVSREVMERLRRESATGSDDYTTGPKRGGWYFSSRQKKSSRKDTGGEELDKKRAAVDRDGDLDKKLAADTNGRAEVAIKREQGDVPMPNVDNRECDYGRRSAEPAIKIEEEDEPTREREAGTGMEDHSLIREDGEAGTDTAVPEEVKSENQGDFGAEESATTEEVQEVRVGAVAKESSTAVPEEAKSEETAGSNTAVPEEAKSEETNEETAGSSTAVPEEAKTKETAGSSDAVPEEVKSEETNESGGGDGQEEDNDPSDDAVPEEVKSEETNESGGGDGKEETSYQDGGGCAKSRPRVARVARITAPTRVARITAPTRFSRNERDSCSDSSTDNEEDPAPEDGERVPTKPEDCSSDSSTDDEEDPAPPKDSGYVSTEPEDWSEDIYYGVHKSSEDEGSLSSQGGNEYGKNEIQGDAGENIEEPLDGTVESDGVALGHTNSRYARDGPIGRPARRCSFPFSAFEFSAPATGHVYPSSEDVINVRYGGHNCPVCGLPMSYGQKMRNNGTRKKPVWTHHNCQFI